VAMIYRDLNGNQAEGELWSDGPEWRDIPAYKGAYQASSAGEIRSLPRTIIRSNGTPLRVRGGVIKQSVSRGRMVVNIGGRVRFVHQLVLEAFVGPRPAGLLVRHLNDNSADNRVENLRYGTPAENSQDRFRLGTSEWQTRTHCRNGHIYSEQNTLVRFRTINGRRKRERICRVCRRTKSREMWADQPEEMARKKREYRARRAAKGVPIK
jgi:hypothetical protein